MFYTIIYKVGGKFWRWEGYIDPKCNLPGLGSCFIWYHWVQICNFCLQKGSFFYQFCECFPYSDNFLFDAVLQFLCPKNREARDCCRSTKYCHAVPTLCFGLSCPGNTPRLTQQCQSLCTLLLKAGVNDPALDLFEAVNLWVCRRSRYLNGGPTKAVRSLA